jgi:hypothetical protein
MLNDELKGKTIVFQFRVQRSAFRVLFLRVSVPLWLVLKSTFSLLCNRRVRIPEPR